MARFDDCSLGVFPDMMPEELKNGAWTMCQNMRFRAGFAERFRGMANVFGTPSVVPYYITPYASMTTRMWVYCGLNKICVHNGTAEFNITPASVPTGTVDQRWTGGAFNGVLVLNNGADVPIQWGGNTASPAAALSNWNANWRARAVRPFKNFLVALGVTKSGTAYPHMVKWSNPAVPGSVPGSWDETSPANEAGEIDLAETADVVVDALPLGDQLIIYKERSMYSMRYVGGQSIMAFQRLPGEVGMLAPGCAVETPIGHVVLTAGDVVVHQGQAATSIADGVIRRWIFGTMNSLQAHRSFVVANPQKTEVLICFPSADNDTCDTAAVFNWSNRAWGMRTLSECTYAATGQINADATLLQWDSDSDAWDTDSTAWNENDYAAAEARVLFARLPNISAFEVGTTDFGAPVVASLERTGISENAPDLVKLIRSVHPRIDAPAGTEIAVSVGGAMNPGESPTWSPPGTHLAGQQHKVDLFASGRFLSMKFESTGYQAWRLRSLHSDIVPMGGY